MKQSLRRQVNSLLAVLWLPAMLAAAPPVKKAAAPRSVVGRAAYYSDRMNGRAVALKDERYDSGDLTAATHKVFPLGSKVRVTNLKNHKSVVVRVNDRMNPKSKSSIDLSKKAAESLDIIQTGHARVRIEMVSEPPRVTKAN